MSLFIFFLEKMRTIVCEQTYLSFVFSLIYPRFTEKLPFSTGKRRLCERKEIQRF